MSGLSGDIRGKLAGIELLSLDTDGVLTDGGLYYTDAGDELRKFNVKDGLGMVRVQAGGVALAIITASKSPAIGHRASALGVRHVHLAVEDKLATLTRLAGELGIGLDRAAHMGDDLNDLPVFQAVGCALTVADAVDAVKAVADHVTQAKGGDGAVREICDLILAARTESG